MTTLHTIVETPEYLSDAKRAGMNTLDRERVADTYAEQPEYGEEVQGSGGVRKGRIAGRGKGKSGGFRVVSIHLGKTIPVYLIAVLSKGDRENFTRAEVNEFKTVITAIKAAYRGRKRC